MTRTIKLIFVVVINCMASLHSYAGSITFAGYTTDANSSVIYGKELDWMKWDATIGMSIEAALAAHEADGWRLANKWDIQQLFSDFGIPQSLAPWPFTRYQDFITVFGVTAMSDTSRPIDDVAADGTVVHYGYREGTTRSSAKVADGYIANVGLDWGIYNTAEGITRISNERPHAYISDSRNWGDAVALVRKVEEPSTILLIAFAIPAIFAVRRKRLKLAKNQ